MNSPMANPLQEQGATLAGSWLFYGNQPEQPVSVRVVERPWCPQHSRFAVEAQWTEGSNFGPPIDYYESQDAAETAALALLKGPKVVAEFTAKRSSAPEAPSEAPAGQ